ncbi:MAG TPA: sulfotransferase [Gemmatimonadales bacterium]|nr:sulfotransferase [Gemmatimonadales bacterium]
MSLKIDSPAGKGKRVRYVCMPGSPYTGSTLLGALLNEHPHCASIGAATGLIRRSRLASYQCSCGKPFQECEFWHRIMARTRALGHPVDVFKTDRWNTYLRLSRNRLINAALVRSLRQDSLNAARDAVVGKIPEVKRAIAEMGWNTWSLASAVLETTGKSVFVDTARDHQRPKYLARHPMLDVRVIHLTRDPRGNAASIVKHTGADAAKAARHWRHYNAEALRVKRYLPPESWMSLRYEELCADAQGVFDRISDFLEVSRAPLQQASGNGDSHIIGNKTRLKGIGEIREDLSWQNRFDAADLAVIARIAGPMSHSLGYQWP